MVGPTDRNVPSARIIDQEPVGKVSFLIHDPNDSVEIGLTTFAGRTSPCRMGKDQRTGKQLMFGRRKSLAARYQSRREIDDEGRGRAVGRNMPFEGRGQQIDTAGSGSVRRRKPEMRQKAVVGGFEGSKPFKRLKLAIRP